MLIPENCFTENFVTLFNNEVNNAARISGIITQKPEFSHEVYEEKFYKTMISSKRKSGTIDNIPLVISEKIGIPKENEYLMVYGQLRSYNRRIGDKNHLEVFIFAGEIMELDQDENRQNDINEILLDGYNCKNAIYRRTPLGREITDLMLAVHLGYGRSSYIPCILWERNARKIADSKTGENITAIGRMQSRKYLKNEEIKETYEVSFHNLIEK